MNPDPAAEPASGAYRRLDGRVWVSSQRSETDPAVATEPTRPQRSELARQQPGQDGDDYAHRGDDEGPVSPAEAPQPWLARRCEVRAREVLGQLVWLGKRPVGGVERLADFGALSRWHQPVDLAAYVVVVVHSPDDSGPGQAFRGTSASSV